MEDGAAEEIRQRLEVPEVGGSLEGLVDDVRVEKSGEGDYLTIRFATAPSS